jgi:hypothetical protein
VPWSLKHFQQSGQLHYITFSCYHRKPKLRGSPAPRDIFVKVLERVRQQYGLLVYGFGANVGAVVSRRHMIDIFVRRKLLGPWTHDEQLDGAVFRLAATFPVHEEQFTNYMIPGDELYPFDPNAFLEKLVEETGIAHTWEPVRTKVEEGGRRFVMTSAVPAGAVPNPERKARHKTRQLLWLIWSRFAGVERMVRPEEVRAHSSSIAFENFLIANTDIIERLLREYREGRGGAGMESSEGN